MNQVFDPSLITKDWKLQDILSKCSVSTKKTMEVFMPHLIYSAWNELHLQLLDFLDQCESQYRVVAGPRGLGKTTILRGYDARKILFRDKHCLVYLGKSHDHAVAQTENLKRELLSNPLIRKMFGNIKVADMELAEMDEMFSKKSWTAFGDIFVNPRGSEQQVRGMIFLQWRPDLLNSDDLEDTLTLDNEMLRKKRYEWWMSDVEKSVPQYSDDWEINYIDTMKHHDSLIVHLINDDRYESLVMPACDENYKALAPSYMNQTEIDAEVEHARKNHTLDIFARERMCIPMSTENKSFQQDMFKYYMESDRWFDEVRPYLRNVVIVDPAKTANMANAQTGFCVWGIDTETNKMYLRYSAGKYFHPEEVYAHAFQLALDYDAQLIACEKSGLAEFITHPFENESRRLGHNFLFQWLTARTGVGEFAGRDGGKAGRVYSLNSYYRNGLIYHNSANCGAYELQILDYPKAKLWDIMDAVAYITQVMEENEIYFMPSMEAVEGNDIEKEYDVLDRLDKTEPNFSYLGGEKEYAPSLGKNNFIDDVV